MPTPQTINHHYLLEKYPGKGGWTYAIIPEIAQNKNNPFGWVKVSGSVDGYPLKQVKLMPMGEGRLFLPVKAAIRKKIKKEAGDTVHVILSVDETPLEIPPEIVACFEQEAAHLYQNYQKLSEGQQKAYLDWIYDARTEQTRADRIVRLMERMEQGLGFYDKEGTQG